MLALHDGRYEALEPHRLPSWQLLVNTVMFVEPSVVRAGHLTNHLLNILVGLSIFLIARLWGHRWIGLGAAALAMLSGHALAVSLRFGVDAAVVALVPLAMVGAVAACRRWQLGLLSGVLAALATATHFSTLGYALPGLAVILLAARSHRWLSALAHVLGFSAVIYLLAQVFPVSTWEGFQVSIANGISPGYQGNGRVSNWDTALGIIENGLDTAVNRSVAQLMVQIRPDWLPWRLALILPWLGVLGIGLKGPTGTAAVGFRGWWRRTDLAMGLGLLFCLAPLPVFAAAQAPLRYADNLLAVGALLLVRGMASVLWMVLQLIRMGHHRWLTQGLYATLGVALLAGAIQQAAPARKVLYPTLEEVGYWQLGQELAKHFSPGSGVASPVREALVEGRLTYCPRRICPERAAEDAYWACLAVHAIECDGTDPVGYVVTNADLYDPNAVARRDMDVWVAKNWAPVATVVNPRFNAQIYSIPRSEIPETIKVGDQMVAPEVKMGPVGGGPQGPHTPPIGPDGRPEPGMVRPPPGTTPPAQPLPGDR